MKIIPVSFDDVTGICFLSGPKNSGVNVGDVSKFSMQNTSTYWLG